MGWEAGDTNLMFYVDGVSIVGRDYEWVQDALTVMVDLFCRIEIDANL